MNIRCIENLVLRILDQVGQDQEAIFQIWIVVVGGGSLSYWNP